MTPFEILLSITLIAALAAAWRLHVQLQAVRTQHSRELADLRQQREAELRAQSERTAALFDRMVEGIIVVGATGKIRIANRAAGALFNFPPPAVDRTVLEATRHHEIAALVARLDREPEVLEHELRIDGLAGTRYLQVNALALRSTENVRDGAILVFHDLTRLRQLETVRQEFVANVSHELRTPLSLIKSAAETLIDGGKSDPVVTARFLEIIDKHAKRLTFLIDDLLLLARLDSDRVELNLQSVSLQAVAQEALDDAASIARARGVTHSNEVPPEVIAQADPDRLRQVLANLIDNAIKYGRTDGRLTLRGRAMGSAWVEISVRDDGPRDSGWGAGADFRTVLPGGQGAITRAGRHGARPRNREKRSPSPRRRGADGERPRQRHGVFHHAAGGEAPGAGGRPERTGGATAQRADGISLNPAVEPQRTHRGEAATKF
jgi:two-component system phosphate regulon sensor histidine kinase PhoR